MLSGIKPLGWSLFAVWDWSTGMVLICCLGSIHSDGPYMLFGIDPLGWSLYAVWDRSTGMVLICWLGWSLYAVWDRSNRIVLMCSLGSIHWDGPYMLSGIDPLRLSCHNCCLGSFGMALSGIGTVLPYVLCCLGLIHWDSSAICAVWDQQGSSCL